MLSCHGPRRWSTASAAGLNGSGQVTEGVNRGKPLQRELTLSLSIVPQLLYLYFVNPFLEDIPHYVRRSTVREHSASS